MIQGSDDGGGEGWIVLTVGINGEDGGRTFLQGGIEACAQRRSLPAVLRKFDGFISEGLHQLSRSIAGAIVDADDKSLRQRAPDAFDHIRQGRLGVVRGHDHDQWLHQIFLPPSLSTIWPSSMARIDRRSFSMDSTACESSAARATERSSPLFR